MKFGVLLGLLCLATGVFAQEKKYDLKLSDVSIRRDADSVIIDGRVENSGDKTLKKIRFFIAFRDPDHQTVSTRDGHIEPKALGPGEDSEFHALVPDAVRAVDVVFRFEDGSGREVDAANSGPFTIE